MQIKVIYSFPVVNCLGEEFPISLQPSFKWYPLSFFLLKVKTHFPQEFLTGLVFLSLNYPRCSLDLVQHLSVLYWKAQKWTKCLRCSTINTDYRGMIAPLVLLTTPLLIQADTDILGHVRTCWLIVAVEQHPKILFQRDIFRHSSPSL